MTRRRVAALLVLVALGCSSEDVKKGDDAKKGEPAKRDEATVSRDAFLAVYGVLTHPRCMNCHPAGDEPLQGDDSHRHAQNVVRGADGRGKYALKCASCHQETNLPGEHMPPGSSTWRLPSAEMPLVFQGLTAGQLARRLKDPKKNGGKTLAELVHHVTEDPLVLWGWKPGDGRTVPPLSHDEFAKRFKEWVDTGAVPPD